MMRPRLWTGAPLAIAALAALCIGGCDGPAPTPKDTAPQNTTPNPPPVDAGPAATPAAPAKPAAAAGPLTADVREAAARAYDRSMFPNAALSVYHLLKAHDDASASFRRTRQRLRGDSRGINLLHVRDYLDRGGVPTTIRAESFDDVLASGAPTIVLLHDRESAAKRPSPSIVAARFLLVRGSVADGVAVLDPMKGAVVRAAKELAEEYVGLSLRVNGPIDRKATDAPDLVCEEIVHGFEATATGDEIRHDFRIHNAGTKPLEITRIEKTCGCAAAMVTRKGQLANDLVDDARKEGQENTDDGKMKAQKGGGGTIPAGESGWISTYVDTRAKQGFMAFRIRIRSNDPEEPDLALTLQGEIVRIIEHDPATVWLRDVASPKGASDWMWVRHYRGEAIEITDLVTSSKLVEATVDPDAPRTRPSPIEGQPDKHYPVERGWRAIRIRVLPGAPIGQLSAAVRAKVNGKPVEGNVAAMVKGNLRVEPAYFSFGQIAKGTAKTTKVTLDSSLGEALELREVTVDRDFMKAEARPLGDGKFQVLLHLEAGWQAYDLQGAVTLHTNDPLEPKKRVIVYGFPKRK